MENHIKNEITVVRVSIATRERLNKLRKEISQNTRYNISTDNLLNLLMDGFDQAKIRSVIHVR